MDGFGHLSHVSIHFSWIWPLLHLFLFLLQNFGDSVSLHVGGFVVGGCVGGFVVGPTVGEVPPQVAVAAAKQNG